MEATLSLPLDITAPVHHNFFVYPTESHSVKIFRQLSGQQQRRTKGKLDCKINTLQQLNVLKASNTHTDLTY